jgi:hypothetical protein
MGNSASKQTIDQLMCSREYFTLILRVLSDAHDVSQYYAELLLQDSLPIALNYYKNYSKETEGYFNMTRKIKREGIDMSYHDFYNQLAFLNYMYEAPTNNAAMRRSMILNVFNKSYIIQKMLVEELYMSCV